MARGPRVITSARSSIEIEATLAQEESERQERAILRAAAARLNPPPVVPDEKPSYPVRFVSEAENLILSLDIPQTLADGAIKHNRFNVRFEQGVLDVRRRVYPFSAERVSAAICACSGYGLGKRFWDFDQERKALDQAQKDQKFAIAREAMKDPELRAALLAEAQADDFDLGEPNPPAPGSTP